MIMNYTAKTRKGQAWMRRAVPALGLCLCLAATPPAQSAVVSLTYGLPLNINTLFQDGKSPSYIVGGILYQFAGRRAPFAFDFDGNGAVDLTISGSGREAVTSYMYVTQQGRNQVWSLAGGSGGLDNGSHALALVAGSSLGPTLTSELPVIGWHNDDDTKGFSILMEADFGRPVSGDFFPSSLFEKKYLGFRFESERGIHYGWMELSAYGFYGEHIYAYSWAYESEPDTALIVGQIPEPALPALLGIVLWSGLRRRRWVGARNR